MSSGAVAGSHLQPASSAAKALILKSAATGIGSGIGSVPSAGIQDSGVFDASQVFGVHVQAALSMVFKAVSHGRALPPSWSTKPSGASYAHKQSQSRES